MQPRRIDYMKDCLEKFGYTTSKSALERHALLKRINKKYGFEYLLKAMNIKIKRISKSKINEKRILRTDLKWIKKL